MVVHPNLPTHPKYLALKAEVGDAASEYLLRLWSQCQSQRSERWPGGPDYVEIICGWKGKPKVLWKALTKQLYGRPGWVTLNEDGTITVTGWEEHNREWMSKVKNGAKGGAAKSAAIAAKKRRSSGATAELQLRCSAHSNLIYSNLFSEEGGGGEESRKLATSVAPDRPDLRTYLEQASLVGVPQWLAEEDWHYQEKKAVPWGGVGDPVRQLNHLRVEWQALGAPTTFAAWRAARRGFVPREKGGGGVAESIQRDRQARALQEEIDRHPANRHSTAYSPTCTDQEKEDLRAKRRQITELKEKIAHGST